MKRVFFRVTFEGEGEGGEEGKLEKGEREERIRENQIKETGGK